jgi:hypothetical protein
MDTKQVRREIAVVKPTARKPAFGARAQRGDLLDRQASTRRDRRQRLLAEAIARHGAAGLDALLAFLETELGEDLGIDRCLEQLIDADRAAVAALITGQRR